MVGTVHVFQQQLTLVWVLMTFIIHISGARGNHDKVTKASFIAIGLAILALFLPLMGMSSELQVSYGWVITFTFIYVSTVHFVYIPALVTSLVLSWIFKRTTTFQSWGYDFLWRHVINSFFQTILIVPFIFLLFIFF